MSFLTVSAPANGTVRREIERLLQDVVPVRSAMPLQPVANGFEDAKGYTLEFDVPGFAPEQLDVLAEDGMLIVRGERQYKEMAEDTKLLFAERPYGKFERRLRLPKAADLASVAANYAQGVLTVRVEKLASVAPRKISVNVG